MNIVVITFCMWSRTYAIDNKVSIIVPVYNVDRYVDMCMDSLINQTLKEIEIICIDDGSTDRSGKILDEYAKKDSRIVVGWVFLLIKCNGK